MKIISKFSDYYDSCTYMCGENIVYERNMNLRKEVKGTYKYNKKIHTTHTIIQDSPQIKEIKEIIDKYITNWLGYIKSYNKPYSIHFRAFVIIGDKFYPFIEENYYDKDNKFIKRELIFDYTSDIDYHYKTHIIINYNDMIKKIREISNEPIISYSSYEQKEDVSYYIKMNKGVMLNPSLKELGFSKLIPAHEVIQEIEMFINRINNVETDVEFSDKQKLNNAGFDKHSFKH